MGRRMLGAIGVCDSSNDVERTFNERIVALSGGRPQVLRPSELWCLGNSTGHPTNSMMACKALGRLVARA